MILLQHLLSSNHPLLLVTKGLLHLLPYWYQHQKIGSPLTFTHTKLCVKFWTVHGVPGTIDGDTKDTYGKLGDNTPFGHSQQWSSAFPCSTGWRIYYPQKPQWLPLQWFALQLVQHSISKTLLTQHCLVNSYISMQEEFVEELTFHCSDANREYDNKDVLIDIKPCMMPFGTQLFPHHDNGFP